MFVTSEPEPGSLIANAPTNSPEQSYGKYFFFYSSDPFSAIWFTQRLEWARYERPAEALALLSSSVTRQCS